MVYIVGNIPSGTYDPNRLANRRFGFPAIDAGDSGQGAKLGGFRGMAVGIGPEIGFIIPL